MGNFLIRGISTRARRHLQGMAEEGNLSLNQYFLRLIEEDIGRGQEKDDVDKRRDEAVRRIGELREIFRQRGGGKVDVVKMIREMRESS